MRLHWLTYGICFLLMFAVGMGMWFVLAGVSMERVV